ncbi:hypothetical protein Aspvir_009438 [Aspergillus viridinutans]|uniref:Fatty acid desaturase domain-containing protein n=1 Tax=Aspergillus viridinutans TaxID=75553 RepID=A0A9P3C522_ASPVI|nr:uncharacterized protein Aspvir_009438 [Aspergillus viridinutans]GIK05331.1 hypothetical protein Aspvir_009438 [Aspergillus viridinutans]
MEPVSYVDPNLTRSDLLVLQTLLSDIQAQSSGPKPATLKYVPSQNNSQCKSVPEQLEAFNNPQHVDFEPTVTMTWDAADLKAKLPSAVNHWLLQPYIHLGRRVVRVETDVVMLTHLILYFTTSVPSALYLYYHFTWVHGVLHWIMQSYYVGTYTLMMHQHIHMGGILAKRFWLFDSLFPYITNPLMGHTWNSYYYHHVKHHHVEGNGPGDLSSTVRYQRDELYDFLCYVGRFLFLVWFELPSYFFRKGQFFQGLKAGFWEIGNYLFIYGMYRFVNAHATLFVFILPLFLLRLGLMIGNWGQHAFVDETDPNSDFRSSITLIDVPSNRFCFNDGYHTSHHLNPRRHWREHPVAFLKQKDRYASEHALVFRNIDYLMITYRLIRKDYMHLAKCLVPMGDQISMSVAERAAMLQSKTRKFTEAEIARKFGVSR